MFLSSKPIPTGRHIIAFQPGARGEGIQSASEGGRKLWQALTTNALPLGEARDFGAGLAKAP